MLGCMLLLLGVAVTAEAEEPAALLQTQRSRTVDSYVQLGNQSARDEKHEVASRAWAVAYTLSPTPLFLFNLAEADRKAGQLREAMVLYQRYLQEEPQTPLRAQIDSRLQVLQRNPAVREQRPNQTFLEQLNRGVQEYQAQRYEAAETALATAYSLFPKLDLLFNLGQAFRKDNKAVEALILYERFLQSAPPGPTRDEATKLAAELKAQQLQQLAAEVKPVPVEPKPAEPEPPEPQAQPPAPPPAVIAPVKPMVPPRTFPYLVARLGLVLGGRSLSFQGSGSDPTASCFTLKNPSSNRYQSIPCANFFVPLAPGLDVQLLAFPLAHSATRWVRGLALLGRLDVSPALSACGNKDAQGSCIEQLSALQLRVEAGVWWHFRLGESRRAPILSGLLHYGYEALRFDAPADGVTRSLPSSAYHYLSIGPAIEVPFYASQRLTLASSLSVRYHIMLAYGDIANPTTADQDGGYGPVSSGHGVRIDATLLEVRPWRGLTVGLGLSYELFLLRFSLPDPSQTLPAPDGPQARFLADHALDQLFGGLLTLGYRI